MALSDETATSSLNESHLVQLDHFLMNKISVYSSDFQKIIFKNLSVFFCQNLTASGCYLQKSLSLIATAFRSKVLKFNSDCWKVWVDYFRMFDPNVLKLLLEESCTSYMSESTHYHNVNATCVEVVVLVELMESLHLEIEEKMVSQILNTLTKLPTNPYLPIGKTLKCLLFANLQLNKNAVETEQKPVVLDFVLEKVDAVLQFVKQKLLSPIENKAVEFDIIKCCIGILNGMVSQTKQNEELKRKLFDFVKTILSNIFDSLKSWDVSKVTLLELLSAIIEIAVEVQSMELFSIQLIQIIINFDRSQLSTRHGSESMFSNCDTFISSLWTCLDVILENQETRISEQEKRFLFSAFQSDITMASNETTFVLTKFSKHFAIILNENLELLCEVVDYLWKVINNHIRDGQGLLVIYKNCIQTILHKNVLCHNDENIISKNMEFWEKIFDLGERKMAVTTIAVENFFAVWRSDSSKISSLINYVNVCVKIATFGPLRQKKEKPFHHLYLYLKGTNQIDETQGFKSFQQYDQEVRITFIDFLLNLPSNPETEMFVTSLLKSFIAFDQGFEKKCFYVNSLVHRQKLRCWQSILLLLPKLPADFEFVDTLQYLFSSCKSDNQLSVRYLIEWVIVLIALVRPQLIDALIQQFDVSSEKKICSVTYILSSLIQLSKSVSDDYFEYIVDQSLLKALPWAQAQHLTSRVLSHVLLEIMNQRIKKLDNPKILERYHFLESCLSLSEKNTAAVKHRKELNKTYYVSTFNAVENFNLETIFHDFLKHHGVLADEWIVHDSFSFPEYFSSNFPFLQLERENNDKKKNAIVNNLPHGNFAFNYFFFFFLFRMLELF